MNHDSRADAALGKEAMPKSRSQIDETIMSGEPRRRCMSGRTLQAESDYGPVADSTATSPHIIQADDGKQYVVKFPQNASSKDVFNEYFASALAKHLGLPVLDHASITLDQDFIGDSHMLSQRRITPGQYFATPYINPAYTLINVFAYGDENIANISDVPRFVVFDVFMNNVDRHEKNCLIVQIGMTGKYRYVLIDHGRCFGGSNWTVPIIMNLMYALYKVPWNTSHITGDSPFLGPSSEITNLDARFIESLIDQVPDKWSVDPASKNALVEALSSRQHGKIMDAIAEKKGTLFEEWI